nr:uncharacterized protein LOC109958708 isoform X2 [Monopterus albus]XP_020453235.1 uncharacterized protein LOC109958708 isoform X2 [Monopterus albus]
MDFPVEARVDLNAFQDGTKVRQILTSHDFQVVQDLDRNKVHIKGSFLKLKDAKAHLECLLRSQTQTKATPYSPTCPPVQTSSSGAISKYYSTSCSVSDGNSSRLGSRDKCTTPMSASTSPSWVSDTSHYRPASPQYRASSSPRPEQCASLRVGCESFVIDGDVIRYAEQLRKSDIVNILNSHGVTMRVDYFGESSNITVRGRSAQRAAGKLQSLLYDLSKSLRTQEVSWKDVKEEALLERILENKNIYNSVLLCEMDGRLHLIGPSGESYEVKQRLLGRPVEQSGRTGRTFDRNSRRRSSSLAAVSRRSTERDSGTITNSSKPVGAAGYSLSKRQHDKQEGAESEQGAAAHSGQSAAVRTRSQSCEKQWSNGYLQQEREKKSLPSKPVFKQSLSTWPQNIKKKFKQLPGQCKKQ